MNADGELKYFKHSFNICLTNMNSFDEKSLRVDKNSIQYLFKGKWENF